MKKKDIIAILIAGVIFTLTAILAYLGIMQEAEQSLVLALHRNTVVTKIFKFFTDIGESEGVIIIAALFLLIPHVRKKIGAPLSVTVTSSWLISAIIKRTVRRARPEERLLSIGGYSFPSGHAMNNCTLYITIMLLTLRHCKTKGQKIAICSFCIFFTLMIGLSRIYFNVHYLSDVICGWCLGVIVAVIANRIYSNIENKKAEVKK